MLKSDFVLNFFILFVLLSVSKFSMAECISKCAESSDCEENKITMYESKSSTPDNLKYSNKLYETPANNEDKPIDTPNFYESDDVLQPSPIFDIRFDDLPKECQHNAIYGQKGLPKNCAEATACTQRSGIYKMLVPSYSYEPFYVECDAETECGDWTIIQRRQDVSVDFFRNWEEYENGFGDVEGEYFIGLNELNALTNSDGPQELLILMEDVNNTMAFAKYDSFAIGNAEEMYKLKNLGRFTGTAGNSLAYQVGMYFSTKDKNNAPNQEFNCADFYSGAGWYNKCDGSLLYGSNLNGKYGDNRYGKGIIWETYNGLTSSLNYVKMMIRRRRY